MYRAKCFIYPSSSYGSQQNATKIWPEPLKCFIVPHWPGHQMAMSHLENHFLMSTVFNVRQVGKTVAYLWGDESKVPEMKMSRKATSRTTWEP